MRFLPPGPTPPDWLHYFSQFDIIISYLFDPDQLFQTNVQQAGSHHYIQGPHRPNDNTCLHAIDSLLQPLEKLAIYDVGMIPDVVVWPGVKPQLKNPRFKLPSTREWQP